MAEAGWRNENAVQNLAALTQVVEAYEAVDKEFDIKQACAGWCTTCRKSRRTC